MFGIFKGIIIHCSMMAVFESASSLINIHFQLILIAATTPPIPPTNIQIAAANPSSEVSSGTGKLIPRCSSNYIFIMKCCCLLTSSKLCAPTTAANQS